MGHGPERNLGQSERRVHSHTDCSRAGGHTRALTKLQQCTYFSPTEYKGPSCRPPGQGWKGYCVLRGGGQPHPAGPLRVWDSLWPEPIVSAVISLCGCAHMKSDFDTRCFLKWSSLHFRNSLSLYLGLPDSPKLAGQQVPEILLPLPSQFQDHRNMILCLALKK